MSNKINGIDVSECPLFYDHKIGCYHTFDGECVRDSCAVYKWLLEHKRLQKENEKLKKKKDEYYLRTLDYEAKISYLIQALEEIKKWATNHNPCDIEAALNCTKEDCFECLNYDIKVITRIINEVLNDRD